MCGDFSDRHLGKKIALKIHENILSCLLVLFIVCSYHILPLYSSIPSLAYSCGIIHYFRHIKRTTTKVKFDRIQHHGYQRATKLTLSCKKLIIISTKTQSERKSLNLIKQRRYKLPVYIVVLFRHHGKCY